MPRLCRCAEPRASPPAQARRPPAHSPMPEELTRQHSWPCVQGHGYVMSSSSRGFTAGCSGRCVKRSAGDASDRAGACSPALGECVQASSGARPRPGSCLTAASRRRSRFWVERSHRVPIAVMRRRRDRPAVCPRPRPRWLCASPSRHHLPLLHIGALNTTRRPAASRRRAANCSATRPAGRCRC